MEELTWRKEKNNEGKNNGGRKRTTMEGEKER
jgi:hypothetical protein